MKPIPKTCEHCGLLHEHTCPRVRVIEYYQDGSVKRIEFHDPQPVIVGRQDPTAYPASGSSDMGDVFRNVVVR